ncbi:phage antirepressor KilAC domain-containing protein [Acidisoma sp. 7E03]
MSDLFDHAGHVSGASYAPPIAGALIPLAIRGTEIRRDAEGRYCLNDCHRAAGAAKKHGPSYFLATDATRALVVEVTDTGNPVSPVSSTKGGADQGTFVVKELVYAYAMWISPAFHLAVIRAFDAMVTGARAPRLDDPRALRQALLGYTERVIALEERLSVTEPRAAALERLAGRKGSETITDTAKALKMRPSDLFAWLRDHKWVFRVRDGAPWRAYQDKINQGLLTHIENQDQKHPSHTRTICYVTPKGRAHLAMYIELERHWM